ncbi:unnamed protein product, partial [Didymodactylos carnosus]
MTVTAGQRIRLRCPIPADQHDNTIIQWNKKMSEDITIAINGKIPKSYQKYYQTELNLEWSYLELFNVERTDSTTYTCMTFETQIILCQYNLVVLIKPESPLLTVEANDIQEYNSVNLKCSAINGNPLPTFNWYRDNMPIGSSSLMRNVENGSILTLNVTRKDNGVKFECEIWNPALSSPLRVEQRLFVKYLPYVNIISNRSLIQSVTDRVMTMEHLDEQFMCQVDANPNPTTIYWILNNTSIISREEILYFHHLNSEQSGNYTCVAENILGKVHRSIYIVVQYAPRVQSIDKILKVNRSDQVILRCSAKSYPNPYEIIWYKDKIEINHQKVFNNDKIEYQIERVERNDTGNYTCL